MEQGRLAEDRRRGRRIGPSDQTTDFVTGGTPKSRRHVRCNLAMPGTRGTHDMENLLRRRLLIAALITAAGFLAFFLRQLISLEPFLGYGAWLRVITGLASAIFVLIATLLAGPISLSVRVLRGVELLLFGTLAVYFAIVQGITLQHGQLVQWLEPARDQGLLVRMANAANLARWFALIVIYGTFVPNTWKRCAVFTGIWVAIPLALSFFLCHNCPIMGTHTPTLLLDSLTMLGVAAAIAIFGSYKIQTLSEEAIQARQLGQYQLTRKIGAGGMGEVYLGEHTLLRRECAIKIVRAEQAGDPATLSRFEREVRAMAKLTHWNTVEIYDYGIADDGTFYYVMEYLPGMSAQEMVEKYGPLPPARAVHLLKQVCAALREAHCKGLIHRDIKPSNVLITRRGGVDDVAKLLDFGLVQRVGLGDNDPRLTMQGTVLGSPPYMSPEQAMGRNDLDPRSDIYSLGALGYYLLTGRPPFVRDTALQVLMAHVHEKVDPPSFYRPEIPADLEQVILKCLSKKREHRFQDIESLEQALDECECAGQWSRSDAAAWWSGRLDENFLESARSAG